MPYAQRRERLREMMAASRVDTLLITSPTNRYYLSGFELHDAQFNESSGCLLITSSGRDFLLTDSRYLEAAACIWNRDDIVLYRRDAAEVITSLLKTGKRELGFEAEIVTAAFATQLGGRCSLRPCDGMVEGLRLRKDQDEIAAMKKSFALNHAMLAWVPSILAEGMTEAEVSWAIEKYFRENGASELAFPSIVAFDGNAALPHAQPSNYRLTAESGVLLDVGCRVDGYCSDQTRSFWFGNSPSDLFRRSRDLVAEAQETVISNMEPGAPLAEVARLASDVFKRAGVEEHFTHSLGHGVGLDTHEKPSLNTKAEGVLTPGMTVTVEPGLYYPGQCGVRLEVTVLVEENGIFVF